MKRFCLIVVILSMLSILVQAQETDKGTDKIFNLNPDNYDLMGLFAKKSATSKIDTNWTKTKWSIFPAIAINPAIGTGYGFGITAGKFLGDPKTTRMSAMSSTPIYTSKGQLLYPFV